jgi:hypothetical protein
LYFAGPERTLAERLGETFELDVWRCADAAEQVRAAAW